jgi:poly(A) polymerase
MIINQNKIFTNEVKIIFDIFGSDIRLVGGCVRDALLNKKINDFDFACKLSPQKIIEKLNQHKIKNIPTGIKFGTITAVINHQNFQITTLRADFDYNGRRCEVIFTDDFFEDAKRRDFTINALYLDENCQLYDFFNGVEDLQNQIVRFVGDAQNRIKEDYLRIFRFLRFSCEYSNNFDEETLNICLSFKNFLPKISKERIREEFIKILNCSRDSNIIKVLKIFFDHDIDLDLWGSKLDYKALEKFLAVKNLYNSNNFEILKRILVFQLNKIKLDILFENFKSTTKEKNLINKFLKITNEYDLLNHDNISINKLLINYSKDLLINIYLIFFAKNSPKLSQKNLENIITYIINKEIPLFPIDILTIKSAGYSDYKLNLAIKFLKNIWAESDFKILPQQLLRELKYIKNK